MEQLKMYWKNNGIIVEPKYSSDFKIVNFNELDNALNIWLDIVQFGLSEGLQGEDFYDTCMTKIPSYDPNYCFFILYKGVPVATVTTVFDFERPKNGLIHMVACKEGYRGLNIGNIMATLCDYNFKLKGMQTAQLKTDDWRLPAIKTYLNIGFTPDLSTDDYKERWEKIYENLNSYKK